MAASQAGIALAAAAAVHGLALVGGNTEDFGGRGISALNPFSS